MPRAAEAHPAARRAALVGVLVVLIALIGVGDYWTGTQIDFSIFFVIPIAIGAWFIGAGASYLLAALSALAWLLADLHGGVHYSSPTIPYWNAVVGVSFFVIIAATLAARRQAERRILELMQVKSEFTAMVSHELRTPLTCIKEGIDIVADGSSGPLNPRQREHLETAQRNVDRLARLVNAVLDYQSLESRRGVLQVQGCDLNRLVAQAAEAFALPAARRHVQLVRRLAPGLPAVPCDPDMIMQVLSNLLGNALKFSDEQKQVVLRTELTGEGVRVSVQDEGPGIPAEHLTKLFQGFSRIPQPGRRKTEGTGLGLAIAWHIVELHGGRLGVESLPGAGSTFDFTLPLVADVTAASAAPRPPAHGAARLVH